MRAVAGLYEHVNCQGLLGTYEDGLAWLKMPANLQKPKCILWMGSSVGNFNRAEAANFLKSFASVLNSDDTMLVGVDACQDRDKVYKAYNDKEGLTHEFVLNGLTHANRLVGKEIFRKADWRVLGEYDAEAGRHQAFVSPVKDLIIEDVLIKAGERIRIEESYKYSLLQSTDLWYNAGLVPKARFGTRINQYREYFTVAYQEIQSWLSPLPILMLQWTMSQSLLPIVRYLYLIVELSRCYITQYHTIFQSVQDIFSRSSQAKSESKKLTEWL